ncbi:MAG: type VII toxin-antitoxin system HepT family RNase toxin [Promethearchaeota archaeon]
MILIRINIIKNKLKIIDENIELVKENLPEKVKEFKALGLVKDGIYKKIEASIQEIISICSIVNSDLKLGIPSNRDDIIVALKKDNILSSKMAEKIKGLKGFRNFLVHRYGKINDEVAFNDIKQGLSDFALFKEEILNFMKNYKNLKR